MRFGVLILCLMTSAVALANNLATDGTYSRQAVSIWGRFASPSLAPFTLTAPDGQSSIRASYTDTDDGFVTLDVHGRVGHGVVNIGPGVGSEVLWGPGSRAFAVTTSDGGANGLFRTIIIAHDTVGIVVRDITPLIRSAFGHPFKCDYPEYPNVGAVKWLGAERLIVAAEIVAHSNCDSFGTFRAYEVDWREMRVVKVFDQITAKRLFGWALGIELRAAPDKCIRTPRQCWVSTNHPSEGRAIEPRPH